MPTLLSIQHYILMEIFHAWDVTNRQHPGAKKTRKTERKRGENGKIKVGCLPQTLFFNAFQLGSII